MKLNLGAGYEDLGPEWVTVDLDPSTDPEWRRDVRDLSNLPDDSADEIRAVDILEHLSYRDTVPALQEWARVLKPGGHMFIQVPAADVMMDLFLDPIACTGGWPDLHLDLDRGVPSELVTAPRIVRLAWRLLGGHFDGQYTRDAENWYLNAHHALFDEETIRWAAEQAGLTVESVEINPFPNLQVWLLKP